MLRPSIASQMFLTGAFSAAAKDNPTDEQRRRNFWSFLTWAFFLSEVIGPDGIMPSTAHAADDEDWQPPDSSRQDGAMGESQPLPPGDIDAVIEPAPQAPPALGSGPAPQPAAEVQLETPEAPPPVSVEARDAASAVPGGSASPASDSSIGDHGGAGTNGDSAGPGTVPNLDIHIPGLDLTDVLPDVSISTPIASLSVDLGGVVGAVLDPVTDIVDGLGEGLGQLPIVGGLLEGVTGTVTSLLGADAEGPTHDAADGGGGALASPGQLLFSDAPEPTSTTDIMSGGQYTDYGVAMQTGLVEGAIDLTQSLGSGIGNITGALADEFDELDSGLFGTDADEGTSPGMTDEIGLRVAGDALV